MEEELERLVAAKKIDQPTAEKIDQLPVGAFCLHKNWGCGQIDSWDLLGDRLLITFEDKPGHAMKLKFAANALAPIPDDHVLAQRLVNLDELKKLAETDPVELVTRALRSYKKSIHLDALDNVIKGTIVTEGKYKSWWDSAKKKLRQDRRFVVPSKRNLPLEMRADDVSAADAMISDLLNAKDLKAKAKFIDPILKDPEAFENPIEQLNPVLEDLNSSARQNIKLMPGAAFELLLARCDLQATYEGLSLDEDDEELKLADVLRSERKTLGETLRGLGVARQRQVLEQFEDAFGAEEWTSVVVSMLNTAGIRGIGELTKFLIETGKTEDLETHLKAGLQQRGLSSDVLTWICKERKGKAESLIDSEFPAVIMASLERDHFDEENRRANRLAEVIQNDGDLIPDLVRDEDLNGVRGFARRLLMSPVFDELTRKSLLARIVKIHPQIQELITGADDTSQGESDSLLVSFESLERRQKEFEHIVNVLQPKNREEIKIAREYGDLRENFEYKAAKQQESVLRRQREEAERDLKIAQGTDFQNADTSKASIGTIVTFEDTGSGDSETFTILGAWDSDPDKGIIAYTTEVGQALLGLKVGDTADLPTEAPGQTRTVKVATIKAYAS